MYPNPQDVLPLPPRPDLAQYRKRAKDLVRACRSGKGDAIRRWAARWIGDLTALQPNAERSASAPDLDRLTDQLTQFATDRLAGNRALAQAQFVIARAHGFVSWPKLAHHLDALAGGNSSVSAFEQAADAIVAGDASRLRRLLRENLELIRARSTREHRATLLHYVSANGVENYRQKTPPNIVEIARNLLDAGAEVGAEADVYGGGATALGLVVTSAHPRAAGVQNELADLLLDRGARLRAGDVRACLMNGCPEAAEHIAARGASVDLQEAAGLGRVDAVRRYLEGAPPREKLIPAVIMAAWYDRRDVVALLLDHGLAPGARDGEGRTALHIAAYEGHAALAELLVQRGAPLDVVDDTYGTPPFVWAMHAWLVEKRKRDDDYRAVLRLLARAGAKVEPEWLEDERVREAVGS
ncbi:MAG TPA: ankyrin repeat domain-containing protein [Longimicrobium sp.]|nr:ankyrin repeat domain-containing protein [Longimicrobium sp.]